ncbi:serine/threonine-protein kinase [uncultured Cellulomonas sp.]|uniref:serine/threonine-protein kinase n=1 Tax=uncultured Cellulomonas sp. TaxID=189682 RepID=UPI00263A13BD|nr:serine/threonine-protein kinase [uncultured Cellulomonas sp.]
MDGQGPAPGTEVGGYRIVAPLGSGGMGTVYRAVDGGGQAVALKVLHPHVGADPAARDRLRREVAALQRLRHPGVAAVLDAEADSTEAFVVTELVDGLTLEQHVARGGPLPPVEVAELAAGLQDALGAVHAAGVVHRDLKPSNVMLTRDGPVLIDFGIAQAADDARVTSAGFVVGTPGYLAPELLADEDPSPATDWWGWAAVLAFAATGRAPFGTRPLEGVIARTRAGDVDLAGVPDDVADPLRGALVPDPARRRPPDAVTAELRDAAARVPAVPATQALRADGAPRTQALRADAGARTEVLPDVAAGATRPIGVTDAGTTRAMPVVGVDHAGSTVAVPVPDAEPTAAGPLGADPPGVAHPGVHPPSVVPAGAWGGEQSERGDDAWDRSVPPGGAPDTDPGGSGGAHAWDGTGAPSDDAPPYVAPAPRRRSGSVLALGLAVLAAGVLYPGVALLVVLVLVVVARTVGVAGDALDRRRERRGGPARGDAARVAAATPWHLLRALVGLVPAVVVAVSAVVVVGGVLWWALQTGRLVVPLGGGGGNGPLTYAAALGLAVLLAVLALWWGPLSRLTRVGTRRTLAAVAPGWSGAAVLVAAALAVAGVLAVLLATGQPVTWWPLPGPPDLR